MESYHLNDLCQKCGGTTLKRWEDLEVDQRFLAERLPASVDYTKAERKKHRFCTRCWFEESIKSNESA